MDGNTGVIKQLMKRYPNVVFIPDDISNLHLVESGVKAGVTVYGSVAHELAFLGVPTIACGDNPHRPFNFCKTATDKAEYKNLMKSILEFKIDKAEAKRESLIFFYMHYLNNSRDESDFLNLLIQWFIESGSDLVDIKELNVTIQRIKGSRQLSREVSDLLLCL